jgi:hypothetical protein
VAVSVTESRVVGGLGEEEDWEVRVVVLGPSADADTTTSKGVVELPEKLASPP